MATPVAMTHNDNSAQHRRKAHNKTRTGCRDCRRRRVKCPEEKPKCRNCIRRKVDCHYPSPAKGGGSSTAQAQSRAPSNCESSSHTPISSITPGAETLSRFGSPLAGNGSTFNLQEIALLHHWVTSTSLDLPNLTESWSVWQIEIPKIAFEHPFVFYAILSVSVLHRAHLAGRCTKSDVLFATQYHNEGLWRFQVEVDRICPDNHEALFAWSSLNALYVFAGRRESYDEAIRAHDPLAYDRWRDYVLGVEWIPMNRGITSLMKLDGSNLSESRLAKMFLIGDYFILETQDIDLGFGGRELERIQDTWADDSKAETYSHTQEAIQRCYAFLYQRADSAEELTKAESIKSSLCLFILLHQFSNEYLRLLQQRQPPALILFSFFGALLHKCRYFWAFQGLGKDIVRVTNELLGAYWQPWIAWPLQVVGVDDISFKPPQEDNVSNGF